MKVIYFSFFLLIGSLQLHASLVCPNDITVTCDTDLSDTDVTGKPILFGSHAWLTPDYIDMEFLSSCNVGYVNRQWYVDENSNDVLDPSEHYCIQRIDLTYLDWDLIFYPPADITLTCSDDIPHSSVGWTAGPCDLIGSNSADSPFDIGGDSCYKILRKHTVIDWCAYTPGLPGWDGEGLYEFDQIIKIIDTDSPVLEDCTNHQFSLTEDCKASVSFTKSAEDIGACSSEKLYWEVEVDLWADGSLEYKYGYNEMGDFKIDPSNNNEQITVQIPEQLSHGFHTIFWKVRDACGNWTSCEEKFETKDLKPPTPYCNLVTYASYDGSQDMSVTMTADMFDVGSFDNCTPSEYLNFAFSDDPQNDSLTINCLNDGFQFFNIYVFDQNGNSDFCRSFLLIFDNGSCNFRYADDGQVTNYKGHPIEDVVFNANRQNQSMGSWQSNQHGQINIHDLPLYEDIMFHGHLNRIPEGQIDIVDYAIMLDHLLYKERLDDRATLAADLNEDHQINVVDLQRLREFLLGKIHSFGSTNWHFIPNYLIDTLSIKNDLSGFSVKDVATGFDITGILKGDISDLKEDTIQLRESKILHYTLKLNENNTYSLIMDDDIHIDLLQISILGTSDIHSSEFNITESNSHIYSNGMNLLVDQEMILSSGQELFSLETEVVLIHGKLIDDHGNIYTLKEQESSKSFVYPNPSNEVLHINSIDCNDIRIYNNLGQNMPIYADQNCSLDISNFPSGKYIIEFKQLNSTIKESFIKL